MIRQARLVSNQSPTKEAPITSQRSLEILSVDEQFKYTSIMAIEKHIDRYEMYVDITELDSFELRMRRSNKPLPRFDTLAIGSIVFPVRNWETFDPSNDPDYTPLKLRKENDEGTTAIPE